MKKIIKYSIPIGLLLVFAITGVYNYLNERTLWNDTFVNGNTPGNFYNKGLFCEFDGVVYFSNPLDNAYLYSMSLDGSNAQLLRTDRVNYINADEHYLYYTRNNTSKVSDFSFLNINRNSLCRLGKDGDDMKVLDTNPSLYASLIGNMIYYIHYDKESSTSLYQVNIDGSDKTQVNVTPYQTCAVLGEYLYYTKTEQNNSIYEKNTSTGQETLFYEGNCYQPIVLEHEFFFMNAADDFKLVRVDRSTLEETTITTDRIETYNIINDSIYFQRFGENAALCRMNKDGSDFQELAYGNYTNINVTSTYVYFSEYGQENSLYRISTSRNGTVEPFEP